MSAFALTADPSSPPSTWILSTSMRSARPRSASSESSATTGTAVADCAVCGPRRRSSPRTYAAAGSERDLRKVSAIFSRRFAHLENLPYAVHFTKFTELYFTPIKPDPCYSISTLAAICRGGTQRPLAAVRLHTSSSHQGCSRQGRLKPPQPASARHVDAHLPPNG